MIKAALIAGGYNQFKTKTTGRIISLLINEPFVIAHNTGISLEAKNIELTEENNFLSGNLKQLEMDFDNFAMSVQSETELKNEKFRLSQKNNDISNQCHVLEKEKAELFEENTQLKSDAEDSKEQIRSLNENLTAVQSALKVLQEKYDKVLKFIEKMQLKEKLEEFLKEQDIRKRQ